MGTSFWGWTNNYWVWEIFSCIDSLAALVCIVVVPLNYDEKPIPDWPCYDQLGPFMNYPGLQYAYAGENCVFSQSNGVGPSQHKMLAFVGYQFVLLDQQRNDGIYHTCMGIKNEVYLLVDVPSGKAEQSGTGHHWGALITISAIAVGPFVQQMSTVQNTCILVSLPVSLGRGQMYLEQTTRVIKGDQPANGMLAAL